MQKEANIRLLKSLGIKALSGADLIDLIIEDLEDEESAEGVELWARCKTIKDLFTLTADKIREAIKEE